MAGRVPALLCAAFLMAGLTGSTPAREIGEGAGLIAAPRSSPVPPRRLFISGHSLTDRPLGDFLAALAGQEGRWLRWNMQHLAGSTLRDRAQDGYRRGVDRQGGPADVLREFGAPADPAYDALILTELHTLLDSLVRNDTIGNALDLDERFRSANPAGQTYLFSAWLDLDDRRNPARWIAYERVAAGAWRCVAERVNLSLAARGAHGRMTLIPAAEGLAFLAEEALAGRVEGIRPADAIGMLFDDDVHLTRAGTYYVALLTHGVLHGSASYPAWAPDDIAPATAEALQRAARSFLDRLPDRRPGVGGADCRTYLATIYAPRYLAYVRDTRWRRDLGWLRAQARWARFRLLWPRLLQTEGAADPLRIRAASLDVRVAR